MARRDMDGLRATTQAGREAHAAGLVAVVALVGYAEAVPPQITREYDIDFVTVGDPGNRGATADEAPFWQHDGSPLGSVDHAYRIARTNISNTQWLEFLDAYGRFAAGDPRSTDLTGTFIFYVGDNPDGSPRYQIVPGTEGHTARTQWRYAARYVNWLHNGKVAEAWAFEDGAYDTSTFGEVVIGRVTYLTDQFTHHPDARFWIPSIHEYVKGAWYDPDRYGSGIGGYWQHPNAGDDPLVAGPPGIGEAAGDAVPGFGIDVMSYPDTLSPWGMMDVSSMYPQMLEGRHFSGFGTLRTTVGSFFGSPAYIADDILSFSILQYRGGEFAMRIAAPIPGVGAGTLVCMLALCSIRRVRP